MHKMGKNNYFIGSIVNKSEDIMPSGVKVQQFIIIDGQQRLTTVMLMLIALRNYSRKNPDDDTLSADEIEKMRIKNQFAKDNGCYKLLLSGENRQIFIDLIEGKIFPEDTGLKLIENYNFFNKKINGGDLKPAELYEAIGKLQIVNITLDDEDDPQAIFESLNSTGKDLSQSDLIRNFVLMRLDYRTQNEIYEKYWLPMEKLFGNEKQDILMDDFFRDYLTMKLSRLAKETQVYEEFKKWFYFESGFENKISELCKDIFTFARYYTNIIFAKSSKPELEALYKEIKNIKMEVSYPFLMTVHEDFRNGLITEDNLIEILRLCVSYVIRRYVCGISSNGMNKTFAALHNEIDTANYMDSLKAKWAAMELSKEFPNDDKFREAFMSKEIYKLTKQRVFYILGSLENFENKEKIIPSGYTIEHVMPQNENLPLEWQNELGPNWQGVQKKYLHTIGNLTLTGYNSELSDRPFMEKMKNSGGYLESGLRLNSFIRDQNQWNEEKIVERAKILADKALKIWQYPHVEGIVVNKSKNGTKGEEYNLESYNPSNLTRNLFNALDRRILNLDDDIQCVYYKTCVAYKIGGAIFADIRVLKSKLKIHVNMKFKEVIDPLGLCREITDKGWNNGDIEISLEDLSGLDNVMDIIEQSFDNASRN